MKIEKKAVLFLAIILSVGIWFLTACSCSGSKSERTTNTKTETEAETELQSGAETSAEEVTIPDLLIEEAPPAAPPADTASESEPARTNEDTEEDTAFEHYELPEISLDD